MVRGEQDIGQNGRREVCTKGERTNGLPGFLYASRTKWLLFHRTEWPRKWHLFRVGRGERRRRKERKEEKREREKKKKRKRGGKERERKREKKKRKETKSKKDIKSAQNMFKSSVAQSKCCVFDERR